MRSTTSRNSYPCFSSSIAATSTVPIDRSTSRHSQPLLADRQGDLWSSPQGVGDIADPLGVLGKFLQDRSRVVSHHRNVDMDEFGPVISTHRIDGQVGQRDVVFAG